MEGFDPRQSSQDRRLLFEVCKLRLDQDDFRDSSDEDPDSTLIRDFDQLGPRRLSEVSQEPLLMGQPDQEQNASERSPLTIN